MIDQDVRQAIRLARQGDKAQAQELLKQVLRSDPDNVDAWVVMAQIVDNRDEAISYMKRAVNLRPGDERARRYLDYLLQQEQPSPLSSPPVEDPGPSNRTILGLAAVALLLCLGFALAFVFLKPGGQQQQQAEITATPLDCEALVEQALTLSDEGCQKLGRNEVCYGHSTIQAELAPGANPFSKTGDVVGINMMEKFVASPMNLDKQEWGIGVFKVEANVPGSLPGQAVTLLIFGSSVDNDSGDMKAFYFSSGLGSIVCENVPFDGILVQMPDGTGVSFRANGADITMMGTGVMEAHPGQTMSVSMLSGIGSIASGGQQQSFGAGQEVSVPLSENLEASGPPSEPVTLVGDIMTMACTLTGIGCPGSAPIATVSQADIQATLSAIPEATAVAEVPTDPASTSRPDQPTSTSRPTATQRPGEPTWTPAPTNTPAPTATSAPTNTQRPGEPTWTPVPTKVPTKVPTTPPPTTPPPTTPPPTTPPPTTPPPTTPPPTTPPPTTPPPTTPPPTTPPPDPCTLISVSWVGVDIGPRNVKFNITNGTTGVITLTDIYNVTWPTSTIILNRVKLGNSVIWNGNLTPPAHPTPDQGILTIPAATTQLLALTFQSTPDPSGYSITVVFDVGCPKSASG